MSSSYYSSQGGADRQSSEKTYSAAPPSSSSAAGAPGAADGYASHSSAADNGSHPHTSARDAPYADGGAGAHGYDGWDGRRGPPDYDYYASRDDYYRGYPPPPAGRDYPPYERDRDRDRYDYYRGPPPGASPPPGHRGRDDYYGSYYGRGPSPPPFAPHYPPIASGYEGRPLAGPQRDDAVSYRPGYSRPPPPAARDDDYSRGGRGFDRDRERVRDRPPRDLDRDRDYRRDTVLRRDDRRPPPGGPRPDRPPRDPRELETATTIFVGNLPYRFREEDVRALFDKHGKIANVTLTMDRSSGHNKGFAFVKFEDRHNALEAFRNTEGMAVEGRRLRLDWDSGVSGDRAPRPPPAHGDSFRGRSLSPAADRSSGAAGASSAGGYASYYTSGASGYGTGTGATDNHRSGWSRRSPDVQATAPASGSDGDARRP
eukprot:Opistho-2@22900